MKTLRQLVAAALIGTALPGCGLFDSRVEWQGGRYALMWIDTPDNISIYRELGEGHYLGRVDATVYAVGWDGRYLVAEQHPGDDRTKVNYFVVDGAADSDYAEVSKAVIGPLSETEYLAKSAQLKLPKFTNRLESLE